MDVYSLLILLSILLKALRRLIQQWCYLHFEAFSCPFKKTTNCPVYSALFLDLKYGIWNLLTWIGEKKLSCLGQTTEFFALQSKSRFFPLSSLSHFIMVLTQETWYMTISETIILCKRRPYIVKLCHNLCFTIKKIHFRHTLHLAIIFGPVTIAVSLLLKSGYPDFLVLKIFAPLHMVLN